MFVWETSFKENFLVYHRKIGFVKDYIGRSMDEPNPCIVVFSVIENSNPLPIGQ